MKEKVKISLVYNYGLSILSLMCGYISIPYSIFWENPEQTFTEVVIKTFIFWVIGTISFAILPLMILATSLVLRFLLPIFSLFCVIGYILGDDFLQTNKEFEFHLIILMFGIMNYYTAYLIRDEGLKPYILCE